MFVCSMDEMHATFRRFRVNFLSSKILGYLLFYAKLRLGVYCVEFSIKSHHITLFKECHVNRVSKVSPFKLTHMKEIYTENDKVASHCDSH